MSERNSFNYLFLQRFAELFHVFFPLSRLSLKVYDYQERIYTHPIILILLILLNESALQFVIYFVGLLPSEFYTSLSKPVDQRDYSAFHWLVIRSFTLVSFNAFLKSFSVFLSTLLYVKWRTRLVLYLHSFYFTQQRYYHLANTTQKHSNHIRDHDDQISVYENQAMQTTDTDRESSIHILPVPIHKQTIDNPDQRIAQDVETLCRTLSTIIPLIIISPFTIVYYTYRTWQVTGYYGPLSIFLYFILWTGVNKIFISGVSRTIFRQNIFEGNFRFLHTQIRTYNEPIAFYNGGSFEHHRSDSYFLKSLLPILYRRTMLEFLLGLSTNLFDYIGSILSYLLLALAIFVFHFYDDVPSEDIVRIVSQTSFVTMYLIYRFNLLNDMTVKITLIAANTHRVQEFVEYMKEINTKWAERRSSRQLQNDEVLVIQNLTYSTPTNRNNILIKNMNLILYKNQHLLITGESGVGKTSLFRILHHIWPINIHGSFSYNIEHSFLLPQRPYFTNQSLHDELSYPNTQQLTTVHRQSEIEQLLNDWNLLHILEYVESNVFVSPKYAWQDLLSPGELQRLSFLRLILRLSSNQPSLQLVFLDEITSAVDIETEHKMYKYLLEQNVTLISIGHRETLRDYHQLQLKISKQGRYIIETLRDNPLELTL